MLESSTELTLSDLVENKEEYIRGKIAVSHILSAFELYDKSQYYCELVIGGEGTIYIKKESECEYDVVLKDVYENPIFRFMLIINTDVLHEYNIAFMKSCGIKWE